MIVGEPPHRAGLRGELVARSEPAISMLDSQRSSNGLQRAVPAKHGPLTAVVQWHVKMHTLQTFPVTGPKPFCSRQPSAAPGSWQGEPISLHCSASHIIAPSVHLFKW